MFSKGGVKDDGAGGSSYTLQQPNKIKINGQVYNIRLTYFEAVTDMIF